MLNKLSFLVYINVYRQSSVTEDLKGIRAEREDFKHRLEAAERRIREYQELADKEKEQSSEMDNLKREHDTTSRELHGTKLRYTEMY